MPLHLFDRNYQMVFTDKNKLQTEKLLYLFSNNYLHNMKLRRHFPFLLDVFKLACTAFGGPQAHITMMLNQFAYKKHYISEQDLLELFAFCGILPGPTSTQTITAIGFKRGRLPLAILTLIVWILPAALVMTALVVAMTLFVRTNLSLGFLKFIQPMAIGFISFSAWRMSKSVITTGNSIIILALATLTSLFAPSVWTFPSIIIASVIIANFRHDDLPPYKFKFKLKWGNLVVFLGIFVVMAVLGGLLRPYGDKAFRPFVLFENFYRFGALVFGGGNLLIPLMYQQFVVHLPYITAQEFLTGVGFQQALPGPVFSIAIYTGGMTMKLLGLKYQLLGCLIAAIAIFTPGTLLMLFLYPFWDHLRNYPFIKRALAGINAASIGMVLTTAIVLFKGIDAGYMNLSVILLTFILLSFEKITPPVIVALALFAGWLL